jgi:hypothetical protein
MNTKAKRKAAGLTCFAVFHICCTASHMTDTILRECGGGLEDKEKALLKKYGTRFNDQGELFRKLGWRLRRG